MEHNDTSLLREIHKLTKENNTILHSLRRDAKRARFWKSVRIIITLGLLFGAYYIVQPLIENMTNAYTSIQKNFEQINQTKNSVSEFGNILGSLKKDTE